MTIFLIYSILVALTLLLIPIVHVRLKGIITLSVVFINAILSGIVVFPVLLGENLEIIFSGTLITGEIPIRIDALSAWFILIINFTIVTGAIYGLNYMKTYKNQTANISIHCIAYLLMQMSLIGICVIQNSLVFLFAWETMAFSSFLLIIFEHHKHATLKAGINFLIQSHVSILFLTVAFIWVYYRTDSYDFNSIILFSENYPTIISFGLYLFFFIGFAIKAGFVPFHTWLPYAHPASPSHISGVMSGVIIKIGIFGILRMLLLIHTDFTVLGSVILIFSVISGVYGVMLAIIQHNIKTLLAYHSIENIGIIGIGIGLGTIGIGESNSTLVLLGFGGGLLHVLNHSLFKSLLFYAAGNVYQATHTLDIEKLGGLIKSMPHTAILFLIAALAICGLPPFNGFVSEFLIYSGLFNGIENKALLNVFIFLFSILGLVLIGGLALLCFTKAFGIIFLGTARHHFHDTVKEAENGKLVPMYLIALFIITIGIFPQFFIHLLNKPIQLFTNKINQPTELISTFQLYETMQYIGLCALGFMVLTLFIFWLRAKITAKKSKIIATTWGCGYTGNPEKMQYTASSFIRSYRKLIEPLLLIKKHKIELIGVFPKNGAHKTHPLDKMEEWLITIPLKKLYFIFGKFRFIQNGNAQLYVLYGAIFITLIIATPFLYNALLKLIEFINLI